MIHDQSTNRFYPMQLVCCAIEVANTPMFSCHNVHFGQQCIKILCYAVFPLIYTLSLNIQNCTKSCKCDILFSSVYITFLSWDVECIALCETKKRLWVASSGKPLVSVYVILYSLCKNCKLPTHRFFKNNSFFKSCS